MVRPLTRGLVIAAIAIAIAGVGSDALGQSISRSKSSARFSHPRQLPNPIRQAGYSEGVGSSATNASIPAENPARGQESEVADSGWIMDSGNRLDAEFGGLDQAPKHAHQILRAPSMLPAENQTARGHHGDAPEQRWVHPPFSSHRQRIQPTPAILPGANQHEIWKTPYSYGYFGASGTRHWSLHHGARDRYTEWTLK